MNFWKKTTALAMSILLVCTTTVLSTDKAYADTTVYKVSATYAQTEARSMLGTINDFRIGSDAWYWNSDDTTKTRCNNLSALSYDYGLEQVAMLRAAEIAAKFSHVRPNGSWCFEMDAYDLPLRNYEVWGENIAAGYGSAASAFSGWREDDYGYDGQGHRRNMLSEDFTSVGIACAEVNGMRFWVQDFGYGETDADKTNASNSATIVPLSIDASLVKGKALALSKSSATLTAGATTSLPKTTLVLSLEEAWPYGKLGAIPSNLVWTSANEKIATVSGGKIAGKAVGKTTLVAKSDGVSKSLSVTVNPKGTSISKVKATSKGFTVKWKKQSSQTTGYQVRYSTSKSMRSAKTKTIKSSKNTSFKVGKLKAKKEYYIQVRTYKTVDGKKYCSSWSPAKVATTKK